MPAAHRTIARLADQRHRLQLRRAIRANSSQHGPEEGDRKKNRHSIPTKSRYRQSHPEQSDIEDDHKSQDQQEILGAWHEPDYGPDHDGNHPDGHRGVPRARSGRARDLKHAAYTPGLAAGGPLRLDL